MITYEMLSRPQRALFVLLNTGLWNRVPEKEFFRGFSESEWREVYRISIEQGVMAIVFDAVMRLPDECKPPRSLKLNWALNVEAQEVRYASQEAVARELSDVLWKDNIPMLHFKGLSLAQFYPIPSHREFGDLDIYLYGKYKEGNQKLIRQGAVKNNDDPKHTSLTYKGISVENHLSLIMFFRYPHLKSLNNNLIELCKESVGNIVSDSIIYPDPDFNAIFVMSHALLHFPSSIVLRHLCDWVVFLEANKDKVDFAKYKMILSEAGLLRAAEAFTALAVRFLGLDQGSAPTFMHDSALEDKILLDILNPFVLQKKNPSPWEIVRFKYRTLKSNRWKYELVNPNRYDIFILHSIYYYLRHPEWFLRLKEKINESSGNC